jgi:putative transposase
MPTDWYDAHMANAALDIWRANRSLYGADKLATAMRKAGHDVGRDQVARLMKILGIKGVRRGKHRTATTRQDPAAGRYPDLIRRAWHTPTRPDQWWVADFTYVWTLEGFVYTSFVTDVCSRRILGWRVSSSKATPLVMSALEQALFTRRRHDGRFSPKGLVFHSDAGSQYTAISFTEALIDAGIAPCHRHRRRRPRQRPHGVDHRALQDRAHRPRPHPPLERPGRGRTGDRQLGPLVQQHQDPSLHRQDAPYRVRGAVPSRQPRHNRRGCVNRASIRSRAVHSGLFETDTAAWIVAAMADEQIDFASRPDDAAPLAFGAIGELLYNAWGGVPAAP